MTAPIGPARGPTGKQDLAVQRDALEKPGGASDPITTDHGPTGTNRSHPGLDRALAAVRDGDTLVVPEFDRPARSVPDARTIADDTAHRVPTGVREPAAKTNGGAGRRRRRRARTGSVRP